MKAKEKGDTGKEKGERREDDPWAEERRASLACLAVERKNAADAIANARREHEGELYALRAKIASLEGARAAAVVEADAVRSRAAASERRAEEAEKAQQ